MPALRDLIAQAGFTGASAMTMYGIVMAESGGNPLSHNTNAGTGDNSYGLAQINMLGSLGPGRLAQYGLSNNDALFDPLTNLKVAYRMSNGGTDFSPWSTFKSGAYSQYANGPFTASVSSMPGSSVSAAGLLPTPTKVKAPFGDGLTLKPPLSASQRAAMVSWILLTPHDTDPAKGGFSPAELAKQPDPQLIKTYQDAYRLNNEIVPGTRPGDPFGPIIAIFHWLGDKRNWVRIGMFTLGAVVLLVMAIETLKPGAVMAKLPVPA